MLAEAMRPLAMLQSLGIDVFVWGMIGLVLAMSIGSFVVRLLPKVMAVFGVLLSIAAIAFSNDHPRGPCSLAFCVGSRCMRIPDAPRRTGACREASGGIARNSKGSRGVSRTSCTTLPKSQRHQDSRHCAAYDDCATGAP